MLAARRLSSSITPVSTFSNGIRLPTTAATTSAVLFCRFTTTASNSVYTPKKNPNRPISPHVTIYKFPLPAITSISHRITGVALTGIAYTVGTLALIEPETAYSLFEAFATAPLPIAVFAKAGVAFSFIYHSLAGFRHLNWDVSGEDFELDRVYQTSKFILGTSVALTALFAIL